MRTNHRVLRIRKLRLEGQTLVRRHGGAKGALDAMTCPQRGYHVLDMRWKHFVSQRHIGPHGVAANRRTFDAAQHAAHGRHLAPGGIAMPGVFIPVQRLVRRLVDLHQAGMIGVAADHRVVLHRQNAGQNRHARRD